LPQPWSLRTIVLQDIFAEKICIVELEGWGEKWLVSARPS
jgi:hypothetical protein